MKHELDDVYLVGGAVRDLLLGREPKDYDFVVLGQTPQSMDKRFKKVGKDFPVYLHYGIGGTEFEIALARAERKTGGGYNGFECDWEGITLEEDLGRRDLTVNSIAMKVGKLNRVGKWNCPLRAATQYYRLMLENEIKLDSLIDPFGGAVDIKNKVFRHVSPAFAEDPVRVLRAARFCARYGDDWKIHKTTKDLMTQMSEDGELEHLTKERVWQETENALMEDAPNLFFEALEGLGLFPELDALRGVEQPPKHHPEIDTFVHVMLCLEEASIANLSLAERYAVLCHDLGKRPAMDEYGVLHGHEKAGVPLVEAMSKRIGATNTCKELALIVCEHHTRVHTIDVAKATTVIKLFELCDAFRRPDRFRLMVRCCEADARGRAGLQDRAYKQAEYVNSILSQVLDVNCAEATAEVMHRIEGYEKPQKQPTGELIKLEIRQWRIKAAKKAIATTEIVI